MDRPKIELTDTLVKKLSTLKNSDHDEYGRELPNPVPLFENVDIEKPLTLQERIQRCMRTEFSRQAYDQGFETAEDASDFDIEGEFESPLPITPYEMVEETPLEPHTAQSPPPEVPGDPPQDPPEPVAETPDPTPDLPEPVQGDV